MTELAKRSTVKIGALEVEGFMLPDGSYRMAQNQAASAIREDPVYALRFLRSKDSKSLLGEGFTDYKPESIELQTHTGKRGQSCVHALPLEKVCSAPLVPTIGFTQVHLFQFVRLPLHLVIQTEDFR